MKRQSLEQGSFILLLIAATLAFGLVIFDYFGAIFWAIILALVFTPLHRRFLKLFNNRKNLASAASLSFCILLAIIPMIAIIIAIVQEAINILETLKDPVSGKLNLTPYMDQMWAAVPETVKEYINKLGDEAGLSNVRTKFEQMVTTGASVAGKTLVSWGQNTLSWVVAFFVMLYLLFFMFRDGEVLTQQVVRCIPLSTEYKKHLFEKFTTVVKATVKGNVVVALIQGILGGLAFYFFDVRGALLWAVFMSFLSLLPAVGASLVWAPVALYFLATGKIWQGIVLIAYGSLVIGMVDNLLRPILIGKDTKLPDYVVLITTLGGMSLVGLTGFVIGPLVAALFLAVWGLLETQREDEEKLQKAQSQLKHKTSDKEMGHKEDVPAKMAVPKQVKKGDKQKYKN